MKTVKAIRIVATSTLFILLSIIPIRGQNVFERSFEDTGSEYAYEILETEDGGYILTGKNQDPNPDPEKTIVMKLDEFGNQVWAKNYGEFDCYGEGIRRVQDMNYMVAINVMSVDWGAPGFSLIKIDNDGEVIWNKNYGEDNDYMYDFKATSDGSFLFFGQRWYSIGNRAAQFFLVAFNEDGDTLWTESYGGSEHEEGYAVVETSDGGYLLAGRTHPGNSWDSKIYLLKIDENRNEVWSLTIGEGEGEDCEDAINSYDGGYIVTSEDEYGLIKINSSGEIVWIKTIDGNVRCVTKTSDGNYAAVGSRLIGEQLDLYLFKFDPEGNILWEKFYGGSESDAGNFVNETSDGGFIIAGGTKSFPPSNNFDIYIIKTDQNGNVTGIEDDNETVPDKYFLNQNYPNPYNPSTMIEYSIPKLSFVTLKVFDVLGREIKTLVEEEKNVGNYQVEFSSSGLNSGIYYYRLEVGNEYTAIKKMVFLK